MVRLEIRPARELHNSCLGGRSFRRLDGVDNVQARAAEEERVVAKHLVQLGSQLAFFGNGLGFKLLARLFDLCGVNFIVTSRLRLCWRGG